MRPDALNSQIGRILGCGQSLRHYLTLAISECELDASGHKAKRLDDLLAEARTALQLNDDVTVPTVSSRTQAVGVQVVVITASEGLDPDIVPPTSAFTIAPARTITGVEIRGATIRLSYSGAVLVGGDSPTVAYTQPTDATVRVRDQAGNPLASFIAAAVTVA